MNIVQIFIKTKSHLDSVRSPRFRNDKVDTAINTAIKDIVLERYDAIRDSEKQSGFQTSQRLRDELYTIVHPYTISTLTPQSDSTLVPKSQFPTDYWLLLTMKATISGKIIPVIPLTYDEWNVIELNPFSRPSIDYPEKVYRNEHADGVEVKFGPTGTMTEAKIYYLSEPVTATIGTEQSSGIVPSPIRSILCYMQGTVTLNGTSNILGPGQELVIPVGSTAIIQSGVFVWNYVNTDLPSLLHEEISKRAASILSGTVENYDRVTDLDRRVDGEMPQLSGGRRQQE